MLFISSLQDRISNPGLMDETVFITAVVKLSDTVPGAFNAPGVLINRPAHQQSSNSTVEVSSSGTFVMRIKCQCAPLLC